MFRSHEDIKFNFIQNDKSEKIFTFCNLNYPTNFYNYKGYKIVILGMIYNIDDDDIFKNLKNIINVNNDDYLSYP